MYLTLPACLLMQHNSLPGHSSHELEIRRARIEDCVALRALLIDTYRGTWLPQLSVEAAEAFEREDRLGQYVNEAWEQFWIAARDQQVCGMVHWRDDFIEALHVSRTHQGMGIGSRLLELAEQQMAAASVRLFRLETDTFNTQSLAFYRKHGYQEIDRYPDTEWNSDFTTVLMHKQRH